MSTASRANGLTEGVGAYSRQSYSHSAQLLLPRAERGDRWAQTYIGVMYMHGQGLPQDFEESARWLREASNAGVPTAQYFLGLLYDRGQGVPQDLVLSQAWLILAVAHADPYLRVRWVKIRDALAAQMTHADLDEAQRLALQFHATVR